MEHSINTRRDWHRRFYGAKKFFALVFFASFSIVANAYNFKTDDGLCYNRNSDGETVTLTYENSANPRYTSLSGVVVIPETVTRNDVTYTVSAIDDDAFSGCAGLTSITMPSTIKSIGNNAFNGCTNLANFNFSMISNISSIGKDILDNTAWMDNHPDGMVYLCKWLIKYKGIMPQESDMEVIAGTLGIGPSAFSGCLGLKSITIPSSVSYFSEKVFYGCDNLEILFWNAVNVKFNGTSSRPLTGNTRLHTIIFGDEVKTISPFLTQDITGLERVTIGKSVTSCELAFVNCVGLTDITWNSVKCGDFYNQDKSPFRGLKLRNIVIGNEVKRIPSYLFSNQALLKTVEFPNSLNSIGNYAFYSCKGITNIIIPSVNSIGENAFSYCSELTNVSIGNNIETIGKRAFLACRKLTSINMGNSLKTIEDEAFCACTGITNVNLGSSLKTIGESAFSGCSSLTNITLPNSVVTLDKYAFSGCSGLKSVTLGNSIVNINSYTFRNCTSLDSITIPESVIVIYYNAFENCSGLKRINLGTSVQRIVGAFTNCTGLTSITFPSQVYYVSGESLKNCTNIRKVVWDVKKFSNMEPLYSGEPDYTNENDTPFTCLENLDTFVLGDNVTYVPGYICAQVQSLKNLIIGKSVTEFGDWAFEGCSGLREITNFNSTPQKGAKYGFSGVDKSACILLVPDESIELYKSTEVWRDFFISGINSGCLIGDVDNSGLIDVSDVEELADFVMGGLPEQFYKIVADVNEDGIIDVTDVVLTANRAMGD